jgi:1-deoxy-D-xylulose-5-phosphate reductoisomerase
VSARRVSVFGATGSVGASTLDLIGRDPDAYAVVALTAHGDVAGLAAAARAHGAAIAVIGREDLYADLKHALSGSDVEAAAGEAALIDAARAGAEWTMASIVGCAGLRPTMAALETGGTVALANKESLVSAGALMMQAATASGATLLPVDSEHNAIFQCLAGGRLEDVARIILTASGGPFRTLDYADMRGITPAQAVAHPNWSMGAKISVDSATMMNKGLELIEAAHLFPVGLGASRSPARSPGPGGSRRPAGRLISPRSAAWTSRRRTANASPRCASRGRRRRRAASRRRS